MGMDFLIRILGDTSNAKKAVDQFSDDIDKSTSSWSTKSAALASTIGNVGADMISNLASTVEAYVAEAATASDGTAKFGKTLEFAGLDTSKIDALKKSTQEYADSTVYSLTDIQSITATLASNGVEGYDTLAMSLGNLNAIAGGNAETFGRVGSVLTQTAGQGKLTTENWNQLTDAIPGASGKLQEALLQAGAYTGNFRDAMAAGEITADEFNAAIQKVGSEPVAVEAAKSVETFEGSQGNLAAAIQSELVKALDLVKPAFTGIQNGLAWFIQNSGLFVPLISGIGVALLVVFAPAIWAAVVATWAFTAALLANPMTWIIVGIIALVAAIVWLVQNWDAVVAWIVQVWGGFIGWITDGLNAFGSWWNQIWAGFATWITDVWNGFIGWIQDVWNGFVGWLTSSVEFIVGMWNAYWTLVALGFSLIWSGIVQFAQGVWNGFVGWIQGAIGWVGGIIQSGMSAVSDAWNNTWTGLGGIVRGIWNGILGYIEDGINGVIDLINGMIGAVNSVTGAVGIPAIALIGHVGFPRLATGTVTDGPMFALIGDNPGGREVVAPLDTYLSELRNAAGVGAARASSVTTPAGPVELGEKTISAIVGGVVDAIRLGSKQAITTALRR